jgi:hypothetical protein
VICNIELGKSTHVIRRIVIHLGLILNFSRVVSLQILVFEQGGVDRRAVVVAAVGKPEMDVTKPLWPKFMDKTYIGLV